MNKKGILYRLSIYIFSATVAIISVIVFLNYNFSKRMLMQHIEESAINQSELIIHKIARQIIRAQEITRNVANQSLYYLKNDDLIFFLKNVLKTNQVIKGIHINLRREFAGEEFQSAYSVSSRDSLVDYSNLGNECLFQQYSDLYDQLERESNGFWSSPYVCNHTNEEVISYNYPLIIPGNDKIVGNVSCEIAMKYINEGVSGIKIGEEGISFIVDKSGLYLTHPVKEWIMKKNLFDLSPKILPVDIAQLKKAIEEGHHGSGFAYPEFFNYRKSWFYYAPMPFINWTIIILIPEKELFFDLWLIFRQIVVVSLVGILLIFTTIIIILRRTLSPLAQITKDIQDFSFEGRKRNVNNEINSLVESLEELQIRYSQLMDEQKQTKKDKRKFEKDMKSAKEIQLNIIPSGHPAFPEREEIDLYAILRPAQIIGGDLYDYFFIDPNHLLFTIGDVSGKGIPASLFMAVAHTLMKSDTNVLSSRHIVEQLNKKLCQKNSNQHFLTLFVGILDVKNGIIDYCNAAHHYPYILRASGTIDILNETHGLPIGIYQNKSYNSGSVVLKTGDTILLYTDGVIDCRDENDNTYGQQRFEDNLHNLQKLSCFKMVTKIEKSLNLFKGKSLQTDDISLMALLYRGADNS